MLTADGDIVNSGGLVAPAGPALGVIVRSASVTSIRPLAQRLDSLAANQMTEAQLRAGLHDIRGAIYLVLFGYTEYLFRLFGFDFDKEVYFLSLTALVADYYELVEELELRRPTCRSATLMNAPSNSVRPACPSARLLLIIRCAAIWFTNPG